MELTVEKQDIINVGHTWYEEDGKLAVVCGFETSGIEKILLRSILLCFGDYRIVDTYDLCNEDEDGNPTDGSEIVFVTDLPYARFKEMAN